MPGHVPDLETSQRTGPPHDGLSARDAESYAEKMMLLAVEQYGERDEPELVPGQERRFRGR
ncbi:hypothetical protein GCM10009603_39480 [Nocardiopsis exhalans]